jgi:TRAP-type C4-dicarboxylate transport system permease small subunit
MKKLKLLLSTVDNLSDYVFKFCAFICLPLLVLLITLDVVLRYVFNSPLIWAIDANELMLCIVMFGSLLYVTKEAGHIRVNLLYRKLNKKLIRIVNSLIAVSGLSFSIVLIVQVLKELPFQIEIGRTTEFLEIPYWVMSGVALIAAVVLSFYFLKYFTMRDRDSD